MDRDGIAADLVATPLEGRTVECAGGSGPRHLRFSATEDALYVLTKFSGEGLRFDRGAVPAHDRSKGLMHSVNDEDPRTNHYILGGDTHLANGCCGAPSAPRAHSARCIGEDGSLTPADNPSP